MFGIFDDPTVSMGTVVSRNIGVNDYLDRNIVRFLDENQNAYDFKRDIYDSEIGGVFRHIGFYGFQRDLLLNLLHFRLHKMKWSTLLSNSEPLIIIFLLKHL